MKLSKDELLADIEQQGSTKKRPPKVAPPTKRGYTSILSLWQDFALRIDQPALVPSAGCMKSFFKMLAIEHEGMLGPRLSLNTLCPYVTRLATAYKHEHDIEIPHRVVKEVKDWIRADLKDLLALSSKARPKPMADSQDLEVLIRYLWVEDKHSFRNQLDRVKLHFFLLCLAYTVARAGAVVVSDSYRNSNEAITYRDLKFHLNQDVEGGPPQMSLTITFKLMKGDRDKEDEFVTITLWEDRVYLHLCPVMPFLTLAYEHDAFDIKPEELFCATLDRTVVEVPLKDAVLDTPLFRAADGTAAWTYAASYRALTELAYRAGYRCQVTSYAIRRGAANILEKSASWAETGILMGHKNPKVLQARYVHKHVGVDLQNLFHKRPAKTDRLRPLRSLAAEHFPGAPCDLRGTDLHQKLREHPQYVERRQEWQDLKQSAASAALVKAAKTKMDVELARLRRVEAKKLREDWIKTDGLRCLRMQQQDNAAQELSKELNDYTLPPWRAAVTEMLFEASDQSQEGRLVLLRNLRALSKVKCGPARTKMVYPCPYIDCAHHEKPFDTKDALTRHSRHHGCRYVDCVHYEKPFSTKAALTRHSRRHRQMEYMSQQMNELTFTRRATLHCGQGNTNTEHFCPHRSCPRYMLPFAFKRDLQRHCDRIHNTSEYLCPHQNCIRSRKPCTNESSLVRHLHEVHSQVLLPDVQRRPLKPHSGFTFTSEAGPHGVLQIVGQAK
ncbi:hypothetical protein V501_00286 [Pseudogymnoascus sp. VKM F-4519 (FW-2642)]|nr:hypothetical protein V501_00286 [Pseudogymnoascus sp. VKM F-4519 (FW-2642)]